MDAMSPWSGVWRPGPHLNAAAVAANHLLQASALMQLCLQLQAASAALEEQHAQLQAEVHQQQQQRSAAAESAAAQRSSDQQAAAVSCAGTVEADSVELLAELAAQLQQDLTVLAAQHKQLHAATKRLGSGFRMGGSIIRARALELGASLEKHCAGAAGGLQQHQHQHRGVLGVSSLPLVVATAVVQHWNDVEMLLSALHQTCENMLPDGFGGQPDVGPRSDRQHAGGQADGLTDVTGWVSAQQGVGVDSGTAARRRALKACRKLVDGLKQLAPRSDQQGKKAGQQQQQQQQAHSQQLRQQAHSQQLPQELQEGRGQAPDSAQLPQQLLCVGGDRSRLDQQQQPYGQQTDANSSSRVRREQPNKPATVQAVALSQSPAGGGPVSPTTTSSSGGGGLGELLAALQAQLAAAASDATSRQQADALGADRPSHTAADSSRRGTGSHKAGVVQAPAEAAQARQARVAAAADVGAAEQSVVLQQQQQQQGSERSKHRSGTRSQAAEVSPSVSRAPCQQSQDEAVRASIRRVERAALLEKIKLMQQCQQPGRS